MNWREIQLEDGDYLKDTSLNGDADGQETVDHEWVERYLRATDWFEGIGSTEMFEQDAVGVITCTSISPGGEFTRVTTFTPVED